MRLGELVEAMDWFKQSIELAERINDPVYTSILHAYLSITLQEARRNIWQARIVSRS